MGLPQAGHSPKKHNIVVFKTSYPFEIDWQRTLLTHTRFINNLNNITQKNISMLFATKINVK